MNIIYSSDNAFVPVLAVSLTSLYRVNRNINVMIIETGISKDNKKLLNSIADKYAQPQIIYAKSINVEEKTGTVLMKDRGSVAQFGRLFFMSFIPELWKRVIYLDCDTLILKPLDQLWEQEMGTCTVGGIVDAFSGENYKMLGISVKDILINSGVMLIDVEKWREQKIERKIISYIRHCNGQVPQGDQGIINYVLKGRIRQLPVCFNVVEYIYDFTYDEILLYRKPVNYYSRHQIEEVKENPVIVHFTTSFASVRPWLGHSSNPYGEEWKKCYQNIYLKNEMSKKKMAVSKKIVIKALNGRTRRLTLCLVGILHSIIKPKFMLKLVSVKQKKK